MENPVSMSREDLEKALEKAQREWQETLERMTPEERAQAEERARKLVEADQAAIEQQLEQARSILGGPAPAAPKWTKFCTNCGAPASGGKFCTNCGHPLQ